MREIELAKNITSAIVGIGTSKIVHTVIKNNVAPENALDTVTVTAGAVVLGSMAADASKKHTDAKIEELVSWWKTNVTKN